MQDYVLNSLNKKKLVKNFVPKKVHKSIKVYTDLNDKKCYVRILSFIKGKIYANSKNNKKLEISLGSSIGIFTKELSSLGHESSFRNFKW